MERERVAEDGEEEGEKEKKKKRRKIWYIVSVLWLKLCVQISFLIFVLHNGINRACISSIQT